MTIPTCARYDYVHKKVFEFITSQNIKDFPCDVTQIIKNNNWCIVPYSEMIKDLNCTLQDAISIFGNDATVLYNGIKYIITFNDMVQWPQRIPFTLMHEVGHIALGHLEDYEQFSSFHKYMNCNEYKIFETEANIFARNVLAPAPIISKISKPDASWVQKVFGLSASAASTRLIFLEEDNSIIAGSRIIYSSNFLNNVVFCNNNVITAI